VNATRSRWVTSDRSRRRTDSCALFDAVFEHADENRVETTPNSEVLDRITTVIREARVQADIVIASLAHARVGEPRRGAG